MEFQKFPYIASTQRKEVANILNIPERAVKIWFQNRRMKEKKDLVGNSESDEQNNQNIVDLAKDERDNLSNTMPTVTEPPYSLPKLTVTPSANHVAHIDLTNFEPNSGEEPDPRKLNYYSNISPPSTRPLPEVSISRIPKPQPRKSPKAAKISHLKYRSSAEFSIDLCKKYKNFGVTETQSKTEDITLKSLLATPPRLPQQSSIPKIEQQSSPEDLSCNRLSITKKQTPSPPKSVEPASPGLIPVYVNYPQPYLSAGNMLWKPVNVVPIMSTGLPGVNVPSAPPVTLPRAQEQSTVKKKCNCDCHDDAATATPQPDTGSNPQAQYVITALPFQNYPKF